MKRLICILLCALCLVMTGCSNEFAEQEYNSAEKIAESADRYSNSLSVFNTNNGEYSFTSGKFDGRETLWTQTVEDDTDITVELSLSLSQGQVKIVHIDKDGTVSTILECTPATSQSELITREISLKQGKNRIKIVGYGCNDVELKMIIPTL